MKTMRRTAIAATVVTLFVLGGGSSASAQDGGRASLAEVAVMGGIQGLNKNDTALPDNFINIPAVATVSYHLTPILSVEGEFTWMIPVAQSVSVGEGESRDMKTSDILAYQGNLRANWSIAGTALAPYVAAGAGGLTFISNTDADRVPQLDESQTMFAINFGTGVTYGLATDWAVRADFREFVAFPSEDTAGLSDASGADEIWMERGTLGLVYRF